MTKINNLAIPGGGGSGPPVPPLDPPMLLKKLNNYFYKSISAYTRFDQKEMTLSFTVHFIDSLL